MSGCQNLYTEYCISYLQLNFPDFFGQFSHPFTETTGTKSQKCSYDSKPQTLTQDLDLTKNSSLQPLSCSTRGFLWSLEANSWPGDDFQGHPNSMGCFLTWGMVELLLGRAIKWGGSKHTCWLISCEQPAVRCGFNKQLIPREKRLRWGSNHGHFNFMSLTNG